MSFRSMFQDVREAMDHVHLSVGATGKGWWWRVLRGLGFSHMHTLGDFGQAYPTPSAGLPQGEDTREPGEICGEGCELCRPLWTPPYSAALSQFLVAASVLPPTDLPLTSPVCHCC